MENRLTIFFKLLMLNAVNLQKVVYGQRLTPPTKIATRSGWKNTQGTQQVKKP